MNAEYDAIKEKERPSSPSGPGQRTKRLLTNTGFLYLRMLLVLVISLFTARIVLRELGLVDYGIYNVVGGFVALVGFLGAALSQTTQRFLAFEMAKESGRVGTVFTTAIIIHVVLAALILAVGHFAGQWAISSILNFPSERSVAVTGAFYFSLLAFSASIVQVPFHSMVVAEERMHIFAGISIFETALRLLIALLIPFAATDRLIHFTGSLFGLSIFALLTYMGFCFKAFRAVRDQSLWSTSLAVSMTSQLGWNLWGNVAAVLGSHGVNILLNIFFGPAVNAARGVAAQVQSAIGMFITNIQTAVNPQITKSYSGGDRPHFERLVLVGAKVYSYIYLLTAVPVIIEADYLIGLWLENPPPHAVAFTQITIATLFASAISGTLFTAAQASGRVRAYNALLGTISLFNIPLSWAVLRSGGAPEVALCVGLALAWIMIPVRVVMVGRVATISPVRFVRQVLLPIAGVTAIVIIFAAIPKVSMEPSFQRAVATAATTALILLAAMFVFGLDQQERTMGMAVLAEVRARLGFGRKSQ